MWLWSNMDIIIWAWAYIGIPFWAKPRNSSSTTNTSSQSRPIPNLQKSGQSNISSSRTPSSEIIGRTTHMQNEILPAAGGSLRWSISDIRIWIKYQSGIHAHDSILTLRGDIERGAINAHQRTGKFLEEGVVVHAVRAHLRSHLDALS